VASPRLGGGESTLPATAAGAHAQANCHALPWSAFRYWASSLLRRSGSPRLALPRTCSHLTHHGSPVGVLSLLPTPPRGGPAKPASRPPPHPFRVSTPADHVANGEAGPKRHGGRTGRAGSARSRRGVLNGWRGEEGGRGAGLAGRPCGGPALGRLRVRERSATFVVTPGGQEERRAE
jgi:hypothetical protein